MNKYILDKYLIEYDKNIQVETFSNEWYYGISFTVKSGRYEIIANKYLGNRLLLNEIDIGWKDIPFKKETFGFLPNGVKVKEL